VLERDQSQRDASIRAIALSKANVHNAEESRSLLSVVTKFAGLLVELRDGHQMVDYAQ